MLHLTKIVHVVGDAGVGKTSLIDVLCGHTAASAPAKNQSSHLQVKIGKHLLDLHFVEHTECSVVDEDDLYIIMFTEKTFKAVSWYIQNKAKFQFHSVYVLNKVDEFINSSSYFAETKIITEMCESIAFISVKIRYNLNTIVTTLVRQAMHAHLPFYDFKASPMLYRGSAFYRIPPNPLKLITNFEDGATEKRKVTACIRNNERLEAIRRERTEQEANEKALSDYQREKGHGVDRNRIKDVSEIKTEILLQHKTSAEYRNNMRLIRNCNMSLRSVTDTVKELEAIPLEKRT